MAKSGKASAKSTDTVAKLKSSYDLVVRGGRVIDPANGIDGVRISASGRGGSPLSRLISTPAMPGSSMPPA